MQNNEYEFVNDALNKIVKDNSSFKFYHRLIRAALCKIFFSFLPLKASICCKFNRNY